MLPWWCHAAGRMAGKAPVDQGKWRQRRQDPGWTRRRKQGAGGEAGSRRQLFLEVFSEQLSRGVLPFGLENFAFLVGIKFCISGGESLVLQLFSWTSHLFNQATNFLRVGTTCLYQCLWFLVPHRIGKHWFWSTQVTSQSCLSSNFSCQ